MLKFYILTESANLDQPPFQFLNRKNVWLSRRAHSSNVFGTPIVSYDFASLYHLKTHLQGHISPILSSRMNSIFNELQEAVQVA
jgi:hypothetical protein